MKEKERGCIHLPTSQMSEESPSIRLNSWERYDDDMENSMVTVGATGAILGSIYFVSLSNEKNLKHVPFDVDFTNRKAGEIFESTSG